MQPEDSRSGTACMIALCDEAIEEDLELSKAVKRCDAALQRMFHSP
jgi:hypothetical protein